MPRLAVLVVAVLALGGTAGCGGGALDVAAPPAAVSTPEPDPAEVQAEARRAVERLRTTQPEIDYYAGMTDAEREASDMAARDGFDARYAEWIKSPQVQALDPRTLPQVPFLEQNLPGAGTLLEATNTADLAVLGTVEETRFSVWGTLTKIRVERTSKGGAPERIVVLQAARAEPGGGMGDPEHSTLGAQLGVSDAEPVLFAGDRAVLLLTEMDAALRGRIGLERGYWIEGYSGGFKIVDGRITAVEQCDFRADVAGSTPDDLIDRIKRYA